MIRHEVKHTRTPYAQNGTHILGQLPVNNIVGGIVVVISVQGIVYAGQMAASWLRIT
jgi:hypothetical protein